MDVSVIIPTLNAECEIEELLVALERQSLRPMEILVVDSASNDNTVPVVKMHGGIHLLQIERCDFNHGATRDMALRATTGDFVCFLTQDALPASDDYLERLVTPMVRDPSVALVSGRQLPKADARWSAASIIPILPPSAQKAISRNLASRRSLPLTLVRLIGGRHISTAADSSASTPTRTCSWPLGS